MSESSAYYEECLGECRDRILELEEQRDVARSERDEVHEEAVALRDELAKLKASINSEAQSLGFVFDKPASALRDELAAARLELERLRGEFDKLWLAQQELPR